MTSPIRPHPILTEHYATLDERPGYIQALFDDTARHYDRMNSLFALGSGAWYRRRALRRSGLRPGMRLLDIAVGTGMVARAALRVTANRLDMIGLDVSQGMLAETRRTLTVPLIQGSADQLPVADASVDFVSMGYALRHVADMACTFREFWRVLRPGGTLMLLEITRPDGRVRHRLAEWYLGCVVPLLCRFFMPRTRSATLMRYFWNTIEHCVPPFVILDQLSANGFVEVGCETSFGLFCTYSARKPDQDSVDTRWNVLLSP
jgi:demethylmenaquinone methyltransferase/2-methoxy-6-polyprenyl-1,4-benzoquinol methylase